MVEGLDVANPTRVSGAGRKMFLTCPLIDQAITLKFRLLSVRVASGAFVSKRKMSVIEILRQLLAISGILLLSLLSDPEEPRIA
jgi:hypothetical protein